MSMYIYLLRNPDSKEHEKMIKAVEALKEVGVSELPEKLATYFGVDYIEEIDKENYLEVGNMSYGYYNNDVIPGVVEYRAEMREGFEIFVKKLPKEVEIIRVYNSY